MNIDIIDPMSPTDRLVLADYLADQGHDHAAERQRYIGEIIRDGFVLPPWFVMAFGGELEGGSEEDVPKLASVNMCIMLSDTRGPMGFDYATYRVHGYGFDRSTSQSLRHLYQGPMRPRRGVWPPDRIYDIPEDGVVARYRKVCDKSMPTWRYYYEYTLTIHPEAAATIALGAP